MAALADGVPCSAALRPPANDSIGARSSPDGIPDVLTGTNVDATTIPANETFTAANVGRRLDTAARSQRRQDDEDGLVPVRRHRRPVTLSTNCPSSTPSSPCHANLGQRLRAPRCCNDDVETATTIRRASRDATCFGLRARSVAYYVQLGGCCGGCHQRPGHLLPHALTPRRPTTQRLPRPLPTAPTRRPRISPSAPRSGRRESPPAAARAYGKTVWYRFRHPRRRATVRSRPPLRHGRDALPRHRISRAALCAGAAAPRS